MSEPPFDRTRRSVVLLGAGASIDAGLPGSWNLTKVLADQVSRTNELRRAFHAIAGAIIAFDSSRGGSAFEALDVERLFSAVQMLAEKDSVELTPFVATWQPGINAAGARLESSFGREFLRALDGRVAADQKVSTLFTKGFQALSGDQNSLVFKRLSAEMIRTLRSVLTIKDPMSVGYLNPLIAYAARTDSLIATLNYDRGIETGSSIVGTKLATGIESWTGGFAWEWPQDSGLRLLKLHGSVDWEYRTSTDHQPGLAERRLIDVVDLSSPEALYRRTEPGLIFGQRGKLRPDGPFMAMLVEFARCLERVDRLVIIGYSFRDEHINTVIRSWYTRKAEPELVIVDPAFPDPTIMDQWERRALAPFILDLLDEMYTRLPIRQEDAGYRYELDRPHRILRQTASSAIADLYSP